MKILFATSEAAPFAKSGGLGDVAGALPQALSKIKGNEVCVILPYYGSIKFNPEIETEYVGNMYVPLAWRNVYAGVFKKVIKNKGVGKNKRNDLVYYFIDNEYYFNRPSFYGDCDDGEKFAFFSKAVLECLPLIGFTPDVIHANDWQTGFLPLFLKAHYQNLDMYKNIRTVYTIHNIEYQGKADPDFLNEVLGVDESFRNICTFDKLINAMKTAIVLCDKLTTVSDTYSHEIRYAYFAEGLESIIAENAYKLSGVVNGIDTDLYNSQKDPKVPFAFKPGDLSGKEKCKAALQEKLGLEVNPDIPIVAMISRLVKHKGLELVEGIANEIMNENIQLVILGTGDKQYEDMFKFMDYAYPGRVSANITFNSTLASEIYAGADYLLMPSKSEPCGLSQLIAMRYGTIPIVRETGGLVDTVPPLNPETLEGRGITFKVFNAHDMLDAVRRAADFYNNKEGLKKFRAQIMKHDSSWKVPAEKYMEIYSF
ncbi:MAG: glycogen synthase GlgA [Clostridia bacterium]|nr:glycogen synthase GlgA [Clostridia bacterium]